VHSVCLATPISLFPLLKLQADNNEVHTFNTSSFITNYFPIPFFGVLYIAYKLVNKSKIVPYAEADFVTGCSADIPNDVSYIKQETLQGIPLMMY
jgi:amino acid permease